MDAAEGAHLVGLGQLSVLVQSDISEVDLQRDKYITEASRSILFRITVNIGTSAISKTFLTENSSHQM